MDSNIILYTTGTRDVSIQVQYEDGTFWLAQKRMDELFGVEVPTINYHLQAILAVGYRVNSSEAVNFRRWASRTLDEFVTKGFIIDKQRLKQGPQFGEDYFRDLLEQIREIRASERRFYQKITDIYALSTDYDRNAPTTRQFFATVQNKLHWAITGQTAAEIIYHTADAEKPHMGLTTWRHAPDGKILKSDVTVAKNYLTEKHIKALDRLVSAYLDLAEDRAEQQVPTTMAQWSRILDGFLTVAERPLLMDAGTVTALEAKIKAEGEYDIYRKRQDMLYESDFDKEIKRLKGE